MPRFSIILATLRRHLLAAAVVLLAGTAAGVVGSTDEDALYESVARIPLDRTQPTPGFQSTIAARAEAAEARFESMFRNADVRVRARVGSPTIEVSARGTDGTEVRALTGAVAGDLLAIERGLSQPGLQAEAEALRQTLAGTRKRAQRRRLERRLATVEDLIVRDNDFSIAPQATRLGGPEPVRTGVLALLVAMLVAVATVVSLERLGRDGRRERHEEASRPEPALQ